MTQISLENIPQYAPSDPLTQRLYNYLQKINPTTDSIKMITREQLYQVGKNVGVSKNDMFLALKKLENIVDCIWYWDSKERTVFFAVVIMSPEEKVQQIEDAIWFESLP